MINTWQPPSTWLVTSKLTILPSQPSIVFYIMTDGSRMRWSSHVWIKSKETSQPGIATSQFSCRSHGQLESAADASLCTYKLIQDLHAIIILFWGLRYSTRMVKMHWIRMTDFVKSKNPREQRTIPYSTAFTSSWTSPKQNYIIKQVIMHSCPRIFLERASLKVQNYRTRKLHYTPQK